MGQISHIASFCATNPGRFRNLSHSLKIKFSCIINVVSLLIDRYIIGIYIYKCIFVYIYLCIYRVCHFISSQNFVYKSIKVRLKVNSTKTLIIQEIFNISRCVRIKSLKSY